MANLRARATQNRNPSRSSGEALPEGLPKITLHHGRALWYDKLVFEGPLPKVRSLSISNRFANSERRSNTEKSDSDVEGSRTTLTAI